MGIIILDLRHYTGNEDTFRRQHDATIIQFYTSYRLDAFNTGLSNTRLFYKQERKLVRGYRFAL